MRKFKLMLLAMVVGVAVFAMTAGGSSAQVVCQPGTNGGSTCSDIFHGVAFSTQVDNVINGFFTVKIGCPTGTPGGCTGGIVLKTGQKVLVPKVQAAAKKKRIKCGSKTFGTIGAGKTAKVKVKATRDAMKVLRKHHKLGCIGTVTTKDGNGVTKSVRRTITLKLKK